ncbi:protein TolR [gamma proteobacterium HTCC5015]|nr:protein TolR [gamma proteobacterium HTCC5015]
MAKKRRPVAEMNVVPYIDVMLVLLVIFMVTAPLLKQGVEVDLPQASSEPVPPGQDQAIVVSIDSEGQLYVSVGDEPESPQSAQQIQALVGKVLRAKPQTPVMVAGDHSIGYGRVVELMTLLQNAGAPKVGLLTEPPES